MTDIALVFTEFGGADLLLSGQDLAVDNGLESSILVSLFCDRRARPDQIRPEDDRSDLRGHWLDFGATVAGDKIGSHLWLLQREKETPQLLARAKQYCEKALSWMIEDRVASAVSVQTSYTARGVMRIDIQIARPDSSKTQYRYDYEWSSQAAKRTL